jgi:DNA repair exonuclease SbcCD nuclease subunit
MSGVRLLVLSDTQLGAGKQLADDRLADQEQVLNAITELAHERDVDVVLHVGDVFENRHPDEESRMVFKRWVAEITKWDAMASHRAYPPRRLVVVAGNHDISNTALASAVDLYDRCEFIRSPRILDLGGCSLACLPWAPIHSLVAGRDSTERTGANAQAAEALVAIARGLREQCRTDFALAGKPALLAAHWSISGVSLPNGLSSDDLGEVVIPQEALLDFDEVLAGHLHARGWFSPNALYIGSPYPNNFGEGNENGVWIWDSEGEDFGDGTGSTEFIQIPSRRLVTIDCDLTLGTTSGEYDRHKAHVDLFKQQIDTFMDSSGEGAATDTQQEGPRSPTAEEGDRTAATPDLRAPIRESNRERNGEGAEHGRAAFGANIEPDALLARGILDAGDLTDATVRIRYRAAEDQHRRINVPALRKLLADAGAHKLYAVEPTILRAGRERVKGLDETANPGAALDAWCEAQAIPQGQREGLHALMEKWSA